jgi:hypothetical protein
MYESWSTFVFVVLLIGTLAAQVAAIVVSVLAGLSSNDLKHKIRILEFRKDTSESASKDATGWRPLRNTHYVRGTAALITSVLMPFMVVGCWAAMAWDQPFIETDWDFLGFVALLMLSLGGVVLTLITYMRGRAVLREAGEVYDWPARPAYGTHPALKFARTLRQTQFVLIWCWLALLLFESMK